jgi:LysR family transcriptional regulator, glycine cleavage system transcriptional activator
MRHRLPPLNAVRAFTASAQHLSFTKAALELHVTHSAISRQIKMLESHLGVALFERKTRQIHLTPAGSQFYSQVSPALEKIGAAAQSLKALIPTRAVRIHVRPTFAVRWLIPRLAGFVAKHPNIEPQVITSTLPPNQAVGEFDLAIRRSATGWPADMQMHSFLEDEVLLVGSPDLFTRLPVSDLSSLTSHVFLQAKSRSHDWDNWKKKINFPDLEPSGKLQFEHLHFVLQAAVDGLGFALAPTSLIAHDMAAGRLISPFPQLRMPLNRYYFAVSPKARPETQLLAEWLKTEQKQQVMIG